MSDLKLPNNRRDRPNPAAKRNRWLAAYQTETRKSVALLVFVTALFVIGIWLIVAGISR
jgi:hypothetical protein